MCTVWLSCGTVCCSGAVWSKNPLVSAHWQLEIGVRVTGRGRIGADGMVTLTVCLSVCLSTWLTYCALPYCLPVCRGKHVCDWSLVFMLNSKPQLQDTYLFSTLLTTIIAEFWSQAVWAFPSPSPLPTLPLPPPTHTHTLPLCLSSMCTVWVLGLLLLFFFFINMHEQLQQFEDYVVGGGGA